MSWGSPGGGEAGLRPRGWGATGSERDPKARLALGGPRGSGTWVRLRETPLSARGLAQDTGNVVGSIKADFTISL